MTPPRISVVGRTGGSCSAVAMPSANRSVQRMAPKSMSGPQCDAVWRSIATTPVSRNARYEDAVRKRVVRAARCSSFSRNHRILGPSDWLLRRLPQSSRIDSRP